MRSRSCLPPLRSWFHALCLASLVFTPAALLSEEAFNAAGWSALEAVVEKAANKKNPAGLVVRVEHAGQSRTLVKGVRALVPAKEEMTEDTVFDAASLTKVVGTAPCVMLLVEQGRVDLEAPVVRYLPEVAGEGRELIRVRHLLTHTSGLKPGIPRDPPYMGYSEGIRRAVQSVPDGVPDSFFRYSDVNFILLGELVQRVSGQRLDQFAQKHFFGPLKMNHTGWLPAVQQLPRIAPTERDETGLMLRGVVHDPTARRMGGVAGHAGLFTCVDDLSRYARMHLGGGELEGVRVLKRETVEAMHRVQTLATVRERRGYGWDLDSGFSRPRGKIFPLGSYGHTGFTGTSLWVDPYSKSFVIFLSSRLHPDGGGSVRDLYEEVGTAAAQALAGVDFKKAPPAFAPREESATPTVLNGVDVLQRSGFAILRGKRVGLITNQTGISVARVPTIDLLAAAPEVKLRALFSPEHGIRGALDQAKIDDSVDAKTGLPVHSLYGERRAPTPEQLAELDVLVFDIQDIGCRFYTYISTLRLAMEAAAKAGKKFVVLDRVNPIGGLAFDGPAVVDKETFTATHPIPLRHGMTVGELARLINQERAIGADLVVVPVEGWRRELLFDQTGLPWINPSPNMRTLEAAQLYPGIGLLEFSISVGRGTDAPFEILGSPYVKDDVRLAHELNQLGLPGLRFVPVRFTPTASVFKDQECGGVRLQITDRAALRSVPAGAAIAATFHRLYGDKFASDKVNTLLNHSTLLKQIRNGGEWRKLAAAWEAETAAFATRRASWLLY